MNVKALLRRIRRDLTPPGNRAPLDTTYEDPRAEQNTPIPFNRESAEQMAAEFEANEVARHSTDS